MPDELWSQGHDTVQETGIKTIPKNELLVQVQCMILDAWGWCTGTTQRDGMGREEGFRIGNTRMCVVDSC